MYDTIKSHSSTRELYAHRLIADGLLTQEQDAAWVEDYRAALERNEPMVSSLVSEPNKALLLIGHPIWGTAGTLAADTTVPLGQLKALSEQTNAVPEAFSVHRVVKKLMDDRLKMGAGAAGGELGLCRDDGLRVVIGRGLSRPSDRPGRGARHFQSSTRGAPQSTRRPGPLFPCSS